MSIFWQESSMIENEHKQDENFLLISEFTSKLNLYDNALLSVKDHNLNLYSILLSSYLLLISLYENEKDLSVQLFKSAEDSFVISQFVNDEMAVFEFIERLEKVCRKTVNTKGELSCCDSKHTTTPSYGISFASVTTKINHFKAILFLHIDEKNNQIKGTVKYNKQLLDHDSISGYIETYLLILEQLSIILSKKELSRKIKDLRFVSNNTYQKLAVDYNATHTAYNYRKTIHKLFEEQVEKTPNSMAVVCQDTKLSYIELNQKANQLAHYIRRQLGTNSNKLVVLFLDRDVNMLITILAVLKSGNTYVPVDPNSPIKRAINILADTQAKIILTNEKYKGIVGSVLHNEEILTVIEKNLQPSPLVVDSSITQQKLLTEPFTNLNLPINCSDIIYVIYTSGTTGKPKGVMVQHMGVVNTISAVSAVYNFRENEKATAFTSYVFDVSVAEFFAPLLNGAELHLLTEDVRIDINKISRYILKNEINHLYLPPVLLANLPKVHYASLRSITYAGEACNREVGMYWSNNYKLFNYFGPTETTIYAIGKRVINGDTNLIGKPIANTTVYVLGDNLSILPPGAIGELYIGGAGVSLGYLNLDELNKEKFIQNPFQKLEEKKVGENAILYKTGDLVKWHPDGNLEYIGRKDFQIKIRGYRVELSEIELLLNKYPGINNSIVVARLHKDHTGNLTGDKHLIAYYVAANRLDELTILSYLKGYLADYMLPKTLVYLSQFPVDVNGKIDRSALPLQLYPNVEKTYTPMGNDLEIKLVDIFAQTLGLEKSQVGIDDDFFGLGGSSILAIHLINELNHQIGAHFDISSVFKYRTVRKLANNIGHHSLQEFIIQDKSSALESYKLSFAQERMWFIDRFSQESSAYNVPLVFKLSSTCEIEKLSLSIKSVVERHEILRTVIRENSDGVPYQVVTKPDLYMKKKYVDSKVKLHECIREESKHIYNLSTESPIRVCYYSYGQEAYLSIVVHHIAFDGWSTYLLLRDIIAYYEYYEKAFDGKDCKLYLPNLSIQYKDFALWQRDYIQTNIINNQLIYWRNKLEGYSSLNLVTDKPRAVTFDYKGNNFHFKISLSCSEKLRFTAKKLNVSLFSLLLSGFYLLIYCYTNQDDIVIGVPVSNRHYLQIEDLIGFFVNTLVMRVKINSQDEIVDFISQVFKDVIDAQLNQDLPFEKLVEHIYPEKDISKHPIFQVMFGVQHFGMGKNKLFTPYEVDGLTKTAKFDLTLLMDDSEEQLSGVFEYAEKLFTEKTIGEYFETYKIILEQLCGSISEPNIYKTIKDFNYIDNDMYQKIVIEDNNIVEPPSFYRRSPHRVFEDFAMNFPNDIALIYEDVEISYQELNQRANQLANFLVNCGQIKPGDFIALYLDRNEYMIISMLAVMKIGATYVPLDPEWPIQRLNFILLDTKSSSILFNVVHADKIKQIVDLSDIFAIPIDDPIVLKDISEQAISNFELEIPLNTLAYVIYTSGTTGNPKGVMVNHEALSGFCSADNFISFSKSSCVLGCSNYAFDGSLFEIFYTLCHGAKLVVADKNVLLNNDQLKTVITRHQINTIFITTALFEYYIALKEDNSLLLLENVLFGGEKINVSRLAELKPSLGKVNVVHVYGPTETVIFSTYCEITPANIHQAPIGRRLKDKTIYVLNRDGKPLPMGAVGELYIGGVGVACGYLNHPELTSQKFIPNPFQKRENDPPGINRKLYKTGDFVRMLPNLDLQYIGRADFQVKIRGHRVELSEIENVMMEHPDIKQSIVLPLKREAGNVSSDYLVGYYTRNLNIHEEDVKEFVENWRNLYDIEYTDLNIDEYKENITGWKSSYTGENFSKIEMLEWRDDTLKRIKLLNPQRVLEIGSGSGLVLSNLIKDCEHYYAVDFSDLAISYIEKASKKLDCGHKITTIVAAADEVDFVSLRGQYDTVILNSIVQYFPTLNYFENVILSAIENISPVGKIFIGDVRDYRLLSCFHYSILKFKHVAVNKDKVDHFVSREKELLIAPEYFAHLMRLNPDISYMKLLPKAGEAINEMNYYRYDVVLYIDKTRSTLKPESIEYGNFVKILNIEEYLSVNKPEYAYIKFPNKRIAQEYVECCTLYGKDGEFNTNDIDNILSLKEIEAIFQKYGYSVLCHLDIFSPLYINIVGQKNKGIKNIDAAVNYPSASLSEIEFANNPVKSIKLLECQDDAALRAYLEEKLPSYMVPTYLVLLDKFPINSNRKIDRKALSNPEFVITTDYELPRNQLERELCEIVANTVGLSVIGINDDFFKIGGNSILAIRLVSKINNHFDCQLTIASVFVNKTIANLSKLILESRNRFELILPLNHIRPEKQAIFMIHPAMAGAEVYVKLAHKLQADYSCFGVDNYNLHCDKKITDLTELATLYLTAIDEVRKQQRQTHMPYMFLGWSLGGIISLEISNILEQRGVTNIKVILLDTIIADPTLIEYRSKQIIEPSQLSDFLLAEGHLPEYIDRIIANLEYETKLSVCKISAKLTRTDVLLFKAIKKDTLKYIEESELSFNYITASPYNNIDRIMQEDNIKLVRVNKAMHSDILKYSDFICDEIQSWENLSSN